jgi:hypothetical protein
VRPTEAARASPRGESAYRSDTEPLGELDQLLAGSVHQLGIGREGDVLGLHRGIDNDAGEVCGLHCTGAGRNCQAFLQQRPQPFLAHPLAPGADRGALKRQLMLEKLLIAEVLIIRVFEP